MKRNKPDSKCILKSHWGHFWSVLPLILESSPCNFVPEDNRATVCGLCQPAEKHLCQLWGGTESLTGSYLSAQTMLWSWDTEPPPRSLKKHSRLISDSSVLRRGGGWACLSLPLFLLPTVNMWPNATHLGLEGTFLLWLDAHSTVNSSEATPDCSLRYKKKNEQRKGVFQPLLSLSALHLS